MTAREESLSAVDERVEVEGFAGNALAYFGAFLISFIGLIHLLQVDEMFDIANYLGFLFLANFLGASLATFGLAWKNWKWAWLLGDLIAGTAFAGFAISRLLGLPGYPVTEASWFNLPGFTAFMTEGAFLTVSLLALTSQGRKLVDLEEKVIEIELSPEPLEREISGIRAGMTADLTDLKLHLHPQALEERAFQNVRGLLRKGDRQVATTNEDAKSVSRAAEAARSHPVAALTLLTALVLAGRKLLNGR